MGWRPRLYIIHTSTPDLTTSYSILIEILFSRDEGMKPMNAALGTKFRKRNISHSRSEEEEEVEPEEVRNTAFIGPTVYYPSDPK